MKYLKLFIALFLPVMLLFIAWPVFAQEPEDFDFSVSSYSTDFEPLSWLELNSQFYPSYTCDQTIMASYTGSAWEVVRCNPSTPYFSIGIKTNFFVYSGSVSPTFFLSFYEPTANSRLRNNVYCRYSDTGEFVNLSATASGAEWRYTAAINRQCQVYVAHYYIDYAPTPRSSLLRFRTDYYVPPPDGLELCPLVSNAHFSETNGWLLSGNAVITDGTLTLGPGDIAAQNLTLQAGRTYSAVISTTSVFSGSTPLNVVLGTDSETLTIEEAGRYTTTFTTPSNLAGPIEYSLESAAASGDVVLDFTCVYTADGSTQADCIAPTNGTFDTADNWYWYRNAAWDSFSKSAALPYNAPGDDEASLVQASIAYTMPVLADTQYLILRFQAQSADEVGLISSKVGTSESEQQAHPVPYDYEVDISTQAGQSVEIAFADSGTSDLLLDNVCIFISDDPPNLPAPGDPDGIGNGIDFGFNYTCNDVPALLAGFGINVYGAQATFEAGVSVWEPQYYIPWLAAALWSNAGRPISCFIVEHMRLAAGIGQQQINEFLNYVSWSVRSTNAGAPWLQLGFAYLKNTIFNPATAARITAAGWLPWWSNQIRSVLASVGSNWLITINWIREAAIYISDAALGSGEGLTDEFPGVGSGFGLLDMVWAMVDLVWWIWNWIYTNIILMISVPKEFMDAFNEGVSAQPFADLVSCSSGNFWCLFLSGVQLVNQTVSDSILYPIVIVGSILITFMVLWEDFWRIVSIEVK